MAKRFGKGVLAVGCAVCLAWGVLGQAAVARAGLEEGRAAWRDGDHARAFEEFMPLAAAGDVTLQNQIAAMYYTGQGVPQDYAKAAEWFRKAASAGSPEAQYCLGKLYYYGQGVPQNFEEAVKQLTEAAQGGKGGAQYLLATLQLYGKGVEANPVKAYFWTLLAVASPDTPAEDKSAAQALRDQIGATLNKRQIESMQAMAKAWTPRKSPPASAPAGAPRRGG